MLSDQVGDVNSGELWVSLDRDADYDATAGRIQQVVDGYAGLDIDVRTYLDASVDEKHGDAHDEDIVVRIYGDDWNILRAKAEEVQKALGEIKGISSSEMELPLEEPQVEIEVNLEAAKQYGVKPGDVRRAATTLLSGLEVGYLFEQQKVFDVVVWGVPEIRHSFTRLKTC